MLLFTWDRSNKLTNRETERKREKDKLLHLFKGEVKCSKIDLFNNVNDCDCAAWQETKRGKEIELERERETKRETRLRVEAGVQGPLSIIGDGGSYWRGRESEREREREHQVKEELPHLFYSLILASSLLNFVSAQNIVVRASLIAHDKGKQWGEKEREGRRRLSFTCNLAIHAKVKVATLALCWRQWHR